MDDLQNTNPSCLSARTRFDAWRNAGSGVDSGAGSSEELDLSAHFLQCQSCSSWRVESEKVEALTNQMHQFDVPEALTQNILGSIARERKQRSWQEHALFVPATMLAFALVLVALPLDSVDGLCSWLLGCVIVAALSVMKQGAVSSRSVLLR